MKAPTLGCEGVTGPGGVNAPHRRVHLIDTTLRDGAQAPGVALTADQRVGIAAALDAIGIDEIEVGCPAMGNAEQAVIRRIVSMKPTARLTAWCRVCEADLDAAAACGLKAVHLSVPGSTIQLAALDKSWNWVRNTLTTLLPGVQRRFAFVSVGVMDASRTEPARLIELVSLCDGLGVDRLRLADTVGLWNPRTAAAAVSLVKTASPRLIIGVHTHNDLGMATANALAALEAGADCADTTVLGLGERAGNAPLEELVMALRTTTELINGIRAEGLAAVCEHVAGCVDERVHARKPIVGSSVFRHESGIHVRGMLRDPRCFEPFGPEAVGRTGASGRQLELGTHSGRAGLIAALWTEGVCPCESVLETLLDRIRIQAETTRDAVSPAQAAAMHHQLVAGR